MPSSVILVGLVSFPLFPSSPWRVSLTLFLFVFQVLLRLAEKILSLILCLFVIVLVRPSFLSTVQEGLQCKEVWNT